MPVTGVLPIYALAVFLLAVAVAGVVIGVHDAAVSRASLGVTISAVVLLVFGVMLFAATIDLFRLGRSSRWPRGKRPPCRPVVLVAFLATILAGVYVFLSAMRAPSEQRPIVVVVALLLVVVALVGLSYFGRDARVTLPRVGAILLGLVATIVGAWEFWFQNQYVPSHAGRAVALDVTLTRAGRQGEYDLIRARLGYKDVGSSVAVIGSVYSLTGSRVVRCQRRATPTRVANLINHYLLDPQRARFMSDVWELRPARVIAAGKFVRDGRRLDPDVADGRDLLFYVPRHRYQLLRFRAQLFAIPASIALSQRRLPDYETFKGDHDLYGLWRVDDDSWLHDLISGRERWIVMRYELAATPESPAISPDLRVTAVFPNARWTKGPPSEAYMKALFVKPKLDVLGVQDASEPFADAELPLEKVAEPTAKDELPRSCATGS
jgi:hypothetical protein